MKLILNLSVFLIALGTFSGKDLDDNSIITKLKRTTDVHTSEITHIKPLSMEVYTSEEDYNNVIKFENGYNDEVWDYDSSKEKHKGFSVSKMKAVNRFFPTTGFKGAEFDVIGSGEDQSRYRCKIANGSGLWISLSGEASKDLGQNCHATFESLTKPFHTVTINLEEKLGDRWVKADSYTINVPQKWAIVLDGKYAYGNTQYLDNSTVFPALNACRKVGPRANNGVTTRKQAVSVHKENKQFRQQYMYKREELTNSPYADPNEYPEGADVSFEYNNNFSRDIDGTFMGEWGYVYAYKKSGFASGQSYWTAEITAEDYGPFAVMSYGYVGTNQANENSAVVCRGEEVKTEIIKPEIAHIKPLSMMVYTSNEDSENEEYDDTLKFSKGYNPDIWDYDDNEHKGFSIAKMKATNKYFPTTGFNGAEFDIIGAGGDQSKYRCRLTNSSGTWVSLSGKASEELGENCRVTFDTFTKPTKTVTINLEYKANYKWEKVGDYTINIPQKWAIVLDKEYQYADNYLNKATKFPALDACRQIGPRADYGTTNWSHGAGKNQSDKAFRQQYMYRLNELTNSPYADQAKYPELTECSCTISSISSFFSRDIDGTFMGEWGRVYDYEKSGWSLNQQYWTAENNSYGDPFYVLTYGKLDIDSPNKTNVVVCRGE